MNSAGDPDAKATRSQFKRRSRLAGNTIGRAHRPRDSYVVTCGVSGGVLLKPVGAEDADDDRPLLTPTRRDVPGAVG